MVMIGSDIGLLPIWCQAITWTNTDIVTNRVSQMRALLMEIKYKINYGISYILAKNDPIAKKQKANIFIEL